MKKTQVALAALALVASTAALANGVTVYGTLDAAVGNANRTSLPLAFNGGQPTRIGNYFDGTGSWSAPSHFGIKGGEDLGNGMKASFVLETGVSLNNGAPTSGGNGGGTAMGNGTGALFTREAKIGLSGDFGGLTFGQQLSPFIVTNVVGAGAGMGPGSFFVNRMLLSGFGAAAVNVRGSTATPNGIAGLGASFNYDGFFIPNAIQYQSPSIGGFTINAMTTTSGGSVDGLISTTTRDALDTESYQAYTVSGSIGPVGVGAGYQTRKNVNSSTSIYGSLPVTSDLTVVASYISNDETKQINGFQAGTGLKIGSTSVFANYRLSDALSAQFGYARNDTTIQQSLTNLSMKYDLSKRTFTYASYATGSGGAEAAFSSRANFLWAVQNALSTSNIMVGLSHSF